MAQLIINLSHGREIVDVCKYKDIFQIGRSYGNDLILQNIDVSRFHATIFRCEGLLYLINHSLNSTFYSADKSPFSPETRIQNASESKPVIEYISIAGRFQGPNGAPIQKLEKGASQ